MSLIMYPTLLLAFSSAPCRADGERNGSINKKVTELDIADLLKVKVTSVSKKAQSLSDAPSAIFVISNEDIIRSGVTSVPEALRLAPGIDVARINSNRWAVSARGFTGGFANKLLVLIDGRSVYTPVYSGVYWDAQDIMLEDVDRIEVIRGPGASLWGSNAVNGVINIITKTAENTEGGLLSFGGGSYETGFGAFRYGKKFSEDTYARAYVKGFQRGNFPGLADTNNNDQWDKKQGGFRIDSRLSKQDELTLQGDLYQHDFNQSVLNPTPAPPFLIRDNSDGDMAGWNLTSKFKHTLSATSEYSFQLYYDHTNRRDDFLKWSLDTLDIDFQHNFELTPSQNFIWGLGYRANLDRFTSTPFTDTGVVKRNTQLFSLFVQDEVTLVDNALWLTLGSKFEHNDYTGFEGQPTAKLLWAPSPKQRLWASISRAVRTPSRFENDMKLLFGYAPITFPDNTPRPVGLTLNGNTGFRAEELLAYELGYRFALGKHISIDLAAFYNDYDSIRSSALGPLTSSWTVPSILNNNAKTHSIGFEASAIWQMTNWWRWDTNYSLIDTQIHTKPGDRNIVPISPSHKVSVRAEITPVDKFNLDLWLRYSSKSYPISSRTVLTNPYFPIAEYVTLDARLAWRINPKLELSVTGQNLLDNRHLEFVEEAFVIPTEVRRGVYGKLMLEF